MTLTREIGTWNISQYITKVIYLSQRGMDRQFVNPTNTPYFQGSSSQVISRNWAFLDSHGISETGELSLKIAQVRLSKK